MNTGDFQPSAPGRLIPTEFAELRNGTTHALRGMAFVPDPLPPAIERDRFIGSLFELLDRAKTSLIRLEHVVGSLPDPNILLAAMRAREVQASSRIENTFASLRDIALADVETQARPEALEVRQNRLAIEAGLASPLPLSARLLKQMHAVLMAGQDPRHARPGEFRTTQVCIGNTPDGFKKARFVPPPAGEHIERCMRDLEHFFNPAAREAPERTRFPELIEMALAHYQFETIHPFSDGNGRLGRALVNISPVRTGLLRHPVCNLSEWVADNRQEYYDRLLRVSTHAEWEPWIRFFCTALAEQAETDLARGQRLIRLHAKYRTLLTEKRNSTLLFKLLDRLFCAQVITIKLAAEHLDVSNTAAQKHIEYLVQKKILLPVDRHAKYARRYIAEGVLKAIRGAGVD